jgi:UDP-N-acetyl-D-galactosamine dehydrogenase
MKKIAVVGLGYVGLPLAIEFGKKQQVIGFDINPTRVEELKRGEDHTLEAELTELKAVLASTNNSKGLFFSSNQEDLAQASILL